MSFAKYCRYKDSGIKWLGAVPDHWDISRLRYLCQCLDGQRIPLNSSERSNKIGEVPYWGANSIMGFVDEALFDEDLVLLGEDGAPFFEPTKPVAFFSQGKVWPNNHIHVLRPIVSGMGRFLVYVLNVTDYASFIDGSTRDKLTQGAMSGIPIPFPPLPEQTAIANFLDRETANIDALIAEQERLIELLKEKRQAVISHAVTKGLNPNVKMKPSGVELLGDIPEHWDIAPLRRLIAKGTAITYGIVQAGPDVEGGVPYIRTSDMAGDEFSANGYLRTSVEIDRAYARSKVRYNDLVVAIRATMGKALLVPNFLEGANLTQGTARVSPGDKLLPRFLFHAFNGTFCQTCIDLVAKGTVFREITLDALRRIPMVVPPLDEQPKIVEFVDSLIKVSDQLVAQTARAINLLKERRTALISAAVTGQIDVRNLTPVESP